MKDFLLEIFAWWRGNTWGTRLYLWLHFEPVGEDQFGNRYYQSKKGTKRWVIYNGPADPTTIPPGWHGWMHYRSELPPTGEHYAPRSWEKPHTRNLTGTAAAYRPDGSLLNKGERPRVSGDYDAWSPE
ncbi:MAG: NADH:ubiquinone oxidoreductase subunit NDUFA12 [Devosia sp.]|nr:NADH:ubiquinone oxidoreductase subunit NDUFA12 [Devosia sp.]